MGLDVKLSRLLFAKQKDAWRLLLRDEPGQLLYGGAAGGGKSALGASVFLTLMAYKFPGTRWLLGRHRLNVLKETSVRTFRDFGRDHFRMIEGRHYTINNQTNVIHLHEVGSEIILKELSHRPSDRDFDALGSLEITGAVLEEVAQISSLAKNTVWSRIRYRLTDFCWHCGEPTSGSLVTSTNEDGVPVQWSCRQCGRLTRGIPPKLLMTCNPTKGWPYDEFFVPWRDGHLPPFRHFVPALPKDNPRLPETYSKALEELDERSRRRLLLGDWEFDQIEGQLVNAEALAAFFGADSLSTEEGALTCDVARFGSDRTVIALWRGTTLTTCVVLSKADTTRTLATIRSLMATEDIPAWRVVVDDDGVGGGVADHLPGCVRFQNNAAPFPVEGRKENFRNLKIQCQFMAANAINTGRWSCAKDIGEEHRAAIRDELGTLVLDDTIADGKLRTKSKDWQKTKLNGRSPDYADAIVMFAALESTNTEPLWIRSLEVDDDD